MKLFTHNMLTSAMLKGVKTGYPLKIEATEVQTTETEFNQEFMKRMFSRVDWPVAKEAAASLDKLEDGLPDVLDESLQENEEFLKKMHHLLMEVEVIEGSLICPESGRKFPISKGIPNMLLTEDEVSKS